MKGTSPNLPGEWHLNRVDASVEQAGTLGHMGHQEFHLIGEYAAIAQNKVFPQAGDVRRVEQGHVGLLGRAVALAVVAGPAGGDHVHPVVNAVLRERNDVFTC